MSAITWDDAMVLYGMPGARGGTQKPPRRRIQQRRLVVLPTSSTSLSSVNANPKGDAPRSAARQMAGRPYVTAACRAAARYEAVVDQVERLKEFYPFTRVPDRAVDILGRSEYPPSAEVVLVPSWKAVFPSYSTAVRGMLFRLESLRFPGLVTPDCAWISNLEQRHDTVSNLASTQGSMTPVVVVDYLLRLGELSYARRMIPNALRGNKPLIRRPLGLYELLCILLVCPSFAGHEVSLDLVCWGDVAVVGETPCIPVFSIQHGARTLRLTALNAGGEPSHPRPFERLLSAEVQPLRESGEVQLELFSKREDFGPRSALSGVPQNTH